ncbi:uncharacterized protein [Eurosta solidaginis]|uniref:uncharacterized protein isoform X2 n=1 Tax=Eurosta solidaginis TaxID=178769 RepID=UPI003530EF96
MINTWRGGLNNVILQANKNQDALNAINKTLTFLEKNYGKPVRNEPMMPYFCNETSLQLFCEDNRYSQHLLLIGRGRKPLASALFQQLSDGISCDAKCIKSEKDFFIGWTNLAKIYNSNLYGVLIVYIDNNNMEHFIYMPELVTDDKKFIISKSRSSLLDFNFKDLVESRTNIKVDLKLWKMYLRIKN